MPLIFRVFSVDFGLFDSDYRQMTSVDVSNIWFSVRGRTQKTPMSNAAKEEMVFASRSGLPVPLARQYQIIWPLFSFVCSPATTTVVRTGCWRGFTSRFWSDVAERCGGVVPGIEAAKKIKASIDRFTQSQLGWKRLPKAEPVYLIGWIAYTRLLLC